MKENSSTTSQWSVLKEKYYKPCVTGCTDSLALVNNDIVFSAPLPSATCFYSTQEMYMYTVPLTYGNS